MKTKVSLKEKLSEVIFVANNHRYEKISKATILYIEAQGSYVDVYTQKGKKRLSTHLKHFFSQLADDHEFVQVSRSFVVNLQHVDAVQKYTLFIGKQDFTVTKQYRDAIFKDLPIVNTKPIKQKIEVL